MTLIYGHRGARGEAPENTLAGFELCLELGVTRCELDLHLSRDGELVVIHDPTLKRTTGRGGKVSEKAVADLVALDARQGGPVWPRPCPIPTLRELFEKCSFEHWQLEVKSASRVRAAQTVRAIAQLVEEFGLQDKVTVTSSSRESCAPCSATPHSWRVDWWRNTPGWIRSRWPLTTTATCWR